MCPGDNNPIDSSSNSCCIKLGVYISVRQYDSLRPQCVSMISISCSQRLTSVYEVYSCMLHVWLQLPFGTHRIATMNNEFDNSGMLPHPTCDACSPISVSGCLLPRIPFFLASHSLLAHFFKTLSTHYCWIHSALSKFSKAPSAGKFPKNLEPWSRSVGVHFTAVSKASVSG